MVEVYPFQGWRYDLAQVGDLSEVTAPPYDVIDTKQQKELYEQHPCNVIRLILNRMEPGDESTSERYHRAAEFLRHWKHEGVLFQEREPAFYVYHQHFEWEGVQHLRKGFLGTLRLEPLGKQNVFAHEQTLAGPKADRLELMKACRMNLSPIFGLYADKAGETQELLDEQVHELTALEAKDDLGTLHRIWPVQDPQILHQVTHFFQERSLYIADGHHRYETALNYQAWLQSQTNLSEAEPANFVMMMFVSLNDPGLLLLPTHRLVSGLPDLEATQLQEILKDEFQIQIIGSGTEAAQETWELMQLEPKENVFGFGTAADQTWMLAHWRDSSPMQSLAPQASENWRNLAVSQLHQFILERLIQQQFPQSKLAYQYVHQIPEVTENLLQKSAQLACLVLPADITQVQQIASEGEIMPAKSTYFFPKILSGLTFNQL